MTWNWLDIAFPWIGLAAAAVLLVLLFGTRRLQGEPTSSKWHDHVWLSWLGVVAYMLHNVEEYGVDIFGRAHAFPDTLCTDLMLPAYPGCPLPAAFYLAVNLSLFWVAAPLGSLLSRRHPLVGLAIYSVIFTNGLMHLGLMFRVGYTPGTLTAAILFLPLSIWVAYSNFGKGRMSYAALALLVANGAILHGILIGSVFLFLGGTIDAAQLVWVQILNAGLLLLNPWIEERWVLPQRQASQSAPQGA
jgi:hypothetical protein